MGEGGGEMNAVIAALVAAILVGCALSPNMTLEQRVHSVKVSLQASADVIPELVDSGDLTKADADKIMRGISKAQKVFRDAEILANMGDAQTPQEQVDLAISALRAVREEVDDPKAKQNISRTIAAITLSRSFMIQPAAEGAHQ